MQRRTGSHGRLELPPAVHKDAVAGKTEITRPPIPARVATSWRDTHRRSPLQFFQQTPSWLSSLILHLGCLLILASLVVPYGKRTRLDQLFITFGEESIHDLTRSPIVVEAPQARDVDEHRKQADSSPTDEQTNDRPPPPPRPRPDRGSRGP